MSASAWFFKYSPAKKRSKNLQVGMLPRKMARRMPLLRMLKVALLLSPKRRRRKEGQRKLTKPRNPRLAR